jgi:hypothetical protein
MKLMQFSRTTEVAAFCAAMMLGIGTQGALADTFAVTYLAAGVQVPTGITPYYETFDGLTYNGTSLVTNFNGSSITGTYTGDVLIKNANLFGGAGGTGQYITPPNGGSYTLTLSSQVNYFGLWFSALDAGNELAFYENNTLLYSFSPADYTHLVGACPTAYCGNPNSDFYDLDSSQLYAYLNFYDTNASFNKIVVSENPVGGEFESDNQAVAMINAPPSGTVLTATPEPSTWVLGLTGLGGLLMIPGLRHSS